MIEAPGYEPPPKSGLKSGQPGDSRDNGRLKPPCNHNGEASDPDRLTKTPLPESGVSRFRYFPFVLRAPQGFLIWCLPARGRRGPRKCYLPR
jgi:hypothetical protein